MKRVPGGCWLIILSLLAGCAATPPSRFYLLTSGEAAAEGAALQDLVLGVGPIRLAAYLERPQIVARHSSNRLKVEEFDRWGGALEANIAWVVAENLSHNLGTDSVLTYPWERALKPAYQVAIDIRRFDLVRPREVRLTALWRILGDEGGELHMISKSDITQPVWGDGFESQVAAQSQALEQMSREIATAIRSLEGTGD
ncbi:MAG: membrane integrity-associated transporter subunit PqiC [Gammaproteobacteria bacterium]|nr:membrane integrity-associated transporter subunit PqiC [Gammaproteobacteria bacterium]